jgi:hypothetical protein
MTINTLTLNSVPIENYGLYLNGLKDWLTIPKRNLKSVVLAMRDGSRVLSPASSTDARTIAASVTFYPSSLLNRRDLLNAFMRATAGRIEIATVEDPTKVCYGELVGGATSFVGAAAFAVLPLKTDLTFLCADPLWYDQTPQAIGIPTINTDITLPMGNASARMRRLLVRVFGPVSSPLNLALKDGAGNTLAVNTIATVGALSASLTGAEYMDIDCDAFSITKYSGGVATDITSLLGTSQDFFALDPQDSPTLAIDGGTAVAYYYRAFNT